MLTSTAANKILAWRNVGSRYPAVSLNLCVLLLSIRDRMIFLQLQYDDHKNNKDNDDADNEEEYGAENEDVYNDDVDNDAVGDCAATDDKVNNNNNCIFILRSNPSMQDGHFQLDKKHKRSKGKPITIHITHM